MDVWIFILYSGGVIQCSFIHFVAQITPAMAPGSLSSVLAIPLIRPHHLVSVVFA